MNDKEEIKKLTTNYQNSYSKEEKDKLSKIIGKILSILYAKETINILNEEDINYLNNKKLFDDSDKNSFVYCLKLIKEGYALNDSTYQNMIKILQNNANKYYEENEKWKNNNTILNFLQLPNFFDDLTKDEVIRIFKIIENSNMNDNEKENLLINLSLSLNKSLHK